ncbi:MAG: peptide chain release factor N(5)-glutamine methyltransferase [Actinomycetota bacterium]
MTELDRLLAAAAGRLAAAGVPSPRHDAEVLAAHVLRVARGQLAAVGRVDAAARAAFEELVARRVRREPLQHLTGTAGFREVSVAVGPGVFVPRPETEVLAGEAVRLLRARQAAGEPAPVAVDLGTGSGAIALALATEVPGAVVHAVEREPAALAWAAGNLAGSGVLLHAGDLADALPELAGGVDLLVSNPPYVPLEAYESVQVEARDFDPPSALWAGPDGLDAIRAVAATAARLLRPGGHLLVEHADVQGVAVPALLAAAGGWGGILDHPDLTGRPRFTSARKEPGA